MSNHPIGLPSYHLARLMSKAYPSSTSNRLPELVICENDCSYYKEQSKAIEYVSAQHPEEWKEAVSHKLLIKIKFIDADELAEIYVKDFPIQFLEKKCCKVEVTKQSASVTIELQIL